MAHKVSEDSRDWPLRPWLLGALLALAGLLIDIASAGRGPDVHEGWRAALTAFLLFAPLAAALTVDRDSWREPLAFAGLAGLVMAGLAWRAVVGDNFYAGPQYGFMAGLLATALALSLFQAGFHRTRFATPYPALHAAVWTDALALGGALVFTGAAWLVIGLLAELFHLLRIDLLKQLMRQDWFGWTWSGGAFGAALGVLRNELAILATLQRVAMVVLAILAVPLAAGLALFLVAMVVSGPDVLWEATRSATPVLLLCAAGAWLLANAIVRDTDADASASRVLRVAALVLALSVLPLTIFAAVSMGTRVAQHGLSPERLWGLVAIGAACAYGLAWLVAVLRGRRGGAWAGRLRQANLQLAVLVSLVAFLLALPILDFGAISARNQIARLERGEISPAKFDFAALRWDFGDGGKRALALLAKRPGEIGRRASATLALKDRIYGDRLVARLESDFNLAVQPDDPELRRVVLGYLKDNPYLCSDYCVVIDLGTTGNRRSLALVHDSQVTKFTVDGDTVEQVAPLSEPAATLQPGSKVEIRTFEKRYVTIDGKPIDQPVDDE